jgi:hypothetical protein
MMNDECRMMNETRAGAVAVAAGKGHHSSFIIPHCDGGTEKGGTT